MTENKKACKNCRYFMPSPRTEEAGYCRYNPPNSQGSWPYIRITDWCGKFYKKSKDKNPIESSDLSYGTRTIG